MSALRDEFPGLANEDDAFFDDDAAEVLARIEEGEDPEAYGLTEVSFMPMSELIHVLLYSIPKALG